MQSPPERLRAQMDANQYDLMDIERIEDLRRADETYLQEILTTLLEETDEVLRQIDSLLEKGQLSRIAELSHRVAGFAKITGARALGESFAALENATLSGQTKIILEAHSRCADIAHNTTNALQTLYDPDK